MCVRCRCCRSACAAPEGNIAGTAHQQYAVALSVGHDARVAKTCIEGFVTAAAVGFHHREDVAPCCTLVLADAGSEVDSAITCAHQSDVRTAVSEIGHGHNVSVACGANGRDAIGDVGLLKGGEHFILADDFLCMHACAKARTKDCKS